MGSVEKKGALRKERLLFDFTTKNWKKNYENLENLPVIIIDDEFKNKFY